MPHTSLFTKNMFNYKYSSWIALKPDWFPSTGVNYILRLHILIYNAVYKLSQYKYYYMNIYGFNTQNLCIICATSFFAHPCILIDPF